MVNEMGNTNSSGEQENAAVDTQQKREAAGNANGVKEEKNIIPEGEIKDYHEKFAALPAINTSTDKEPQIKNSEDDKADEDKGETQLKQPFQCSEVQTVANDLMSEVTKIGTHTFQYEQKVDQSMESILEEKDDVHDQTCNKEDEAEESSPQDEVLNSDPVEFSIVAAETVEERSISSSSEEKETPEKGRSGQNEGKTQLISSEIALTDKTTFADSNDQNVTTQQEDCLVGELAASGKSNEEKYENMSAENQVENGHSIRAHLNETPEVESSQSDATGSLLSNSPQITPLSSFAAVIEPQDKCMVHIPDTNLTSNESDNAVKKYDRKQTESFMHALREVQNDNAAPSVESHPKEAMEEKLSGNYTNTDSLIDYSVEEDNVRLDINVQPDIVYHDHVPPVEQHVNFEETFEIVPEIGVLSTKFIGTATNFEEESSTEDGLLEKAKEGVEESSTKEMTEQCILQLGSSKLENGADIAYGGGRMQGSESVGDHKEGNADLTEHDNCEFVLAEDSGVFELKISEKEIAKIADFAEAENSQDVQPSLDTLAFPNGKCAFDQKVTNFHYETPSTGPASIVRVSLETIPEKSVNAIELRKSPSFDFGVHRRSSESDQTPLLCPDRIPTRSLSVGSNAKFSNSITRTEYNRSSLDYEAVEVEEKTIRVERSDSDISSTPLLGLSNKGENADLKVTSETQQNDVAVMKGENLQASQEKETSPTSPKGSGKRKPRPSFFTTCICCTAATYY
ncbi:unnamed protein product [Withania somnifera]